MDNPILIGAIRKLGHIELTKEMYNALYRAVYESSGWGSKLNSTVSAWTAIIPGGIVIDMPYTVTYYVPGGICTVRCAKGLSWLVSEEWIKDNPNQDPRPTPPDPYASTPTANGRQLAPSTGDIAVVTNTGNGNWVITGSIGGIPITRSDQQLDRLGDKAVEHAPAASKPKIVDDVADIGRRLKQLQEERRRNQG